MHPRGCIRRYQAFALPTVNWDTQSKALAGGTAQADEAGQGAPRRRGGGGQGRAVHVDPVKPKLQAPGCTRLKLKYV